MEIRKNKNGQISFKEKVYLNNGETKTKTFKRKTDALAWKRQMESDKLKCQLLGIPSLKENITFLELSEIWFRKKISTNKSPKTVADYSSILRQHLIPIFGSIKVRNIERGHGDDLIKKVQSAGLSNRTTNKVLVLFKQIISFAEIENYIGKNPLHRLPGLKMSPGRIDYLSQQEILQLLRGNSTEECYPLILVALNTGLRIGELTGLCWDRVNFQTNMIEVSRSLTRSGLANTTKTNLIRYIPMNNEVRDCLEDLLKKQKGPQFVFTDPKGNHYNPDHFSQRKFQQALDRVGVRRVHFHILRHTYASHFMMNGGNIYDLQKILGHTKVDMTMKYAHLSPQHLNRAVETVRFSAEGGDRGHSPFLSPRENNNSRLKVV